VKSLGDWSEQISDRVAVGDSVRIEGPYGGLRLFPRTKKTVVWIAGGVGVTPFLAGSRVRRDGIVPHLFYAVRSKNDAPGLEELTEASRAGRIVLHLHVSEEGTRLNAEHLISEFGDDGLQHSHIVMCGPDALIHDMRKVVRSLGARHAHVEKFDIRTGIGPDLSREVDAIVLSARQRINH
jgi:predicted ferric reductase